MDILLRHFTDKQRSAIETARVPSKLQTWGANALLDAAGYKGPRDNFETKPAEPKPKKRDGRKAPRQTKRPKAPAKKHVPVRPAANGAAKPKGATKAKPASTKNDESWRLEPQFRDRSKKKL